MNHPNHANVEFTSYQISGLVPEETFCEVNPHGCCQGTDTDCNVGVPAGPGNTKPIIGWCVETTRVQIPADKVKEFQQSCVVDPTECCPGSGSGGSGSAAGSSTGQPLKGLTVQTTRFILPPGARIIDKFCVFNPNTCCEGNISGSSGASQPSAPSGSVGEPIPFPPVPPFIRRTPFEDCYVLLDCPPSHCSGESVLLSYFWNLHATGIVEQSPPECSTGCPTTTTAVLFGGSTTCYFFGTAFINCYGTENWYLFFNDDPALAAQYHFPAGPQWVLMLRAEWTPGCTVGGDAFCEGNAWTSHCSGAPMNLTTALLTISGVGDLLGDPCSDPATGNTCTSLNQFLGAITGGSGAIYGVPAALGGPGEMVTCGYGAFSTIGGPGFFPCPNVYGSVDGSGLQLFFDGDGLYGTDVWVLILSIVPHLSPTAKWISWVIPDAAFNCGGTTVFDSSMITHNDFAGLCDWSSALITLVIPVNGPCPELVWAIPDKEWDCDKCNVFDPSRLAFADPGTPCDWTSATVTVCPDAVCGGGSSSSGSASGSSSGSSGAVPTPRACGCGTCPGGTAFQWTFEVEGVTSSGGICGTLCDEFNGVYTLTNGLSGIGTPDPCRWVTLDAPVPPCAGINHDLIYRYELVIDGLGGIDAPNNMTLRANVDGRITPAAVWRRRPAIEGGTVYCDQPNVLPLDVSTVTDCTGWPPFVTVTPVGGSVAPTPVCPCVNCIPGTRKATWTFTGSGFTGAGTVFNTAITLTGTIDPCSWDTLVSGNLVVLTLGASRVTLTFYSGPTDDPLNREAQYVDGTVTAPYDCGVARTVSQTVSSIGGPANITVTPV